MNAKEELLKHIGDREVKYVRIIFDHSFRNRVTNSGITGATASGASQSSNRPAGSLNFRKP
jgi:hypothetical protein